MVKKTTVHSFTVEYEEEAKEAIHFLQDELDYEEAKVFFDQAKLKRSAEFEDKYRHNYTLTYANGIYVLTRRV